MRTGTIDAVIYDREQVVYDSGELAAKASSVSITGLNGNNDDEYRIIIRSINGHTGAVTQRVYPLNDTGSGYGYQSITGLLATISATKVGNSSGFVYNSSSQTSESTLAVMSIAMQSGKPTLCLTKSIQGINTANATRLECFATSWSNVTSNITSITAGGDSNSYGVGSRVILMRKVVDSAGKQTGAIDVSGDVEDCWQKVYNVTLASACSSAVITGLTGDTDILYRIRIRNVTGTAGPSVVYIQPNSDADTANYAQLQYIDGSGSTASAGRSLIPGISGGQGLTSEGYVSLSETILYAKSGYLRSSIGDVTKGVYGTKIASVQVLGGAWKNTADEITSMKIAAQGVNGLGIGTFIELEKLNL